MPKQIFFIVDANSGLGLTIAQVTLTKDLYDLPEI